MVYCDYNARYNASCRSLIGGQISDTDHGESFTLTRPLNLVCCCLGGAGTQLSSGRPADRLHRHVVVARDEFRTTTFGFVRCSSGLRTRALLLLSLLFLESLLLPIAHKVPGISLFEKGAQRLASRKNVNRTIQLLIKRYR